MSLLELPPDFIHEPPENYTYEVESFRHNVLRIWCCNNSKFTYNGGAPAKTIWGFYNVKQRAYIAPINSKKPGERVSINNTTPYTAMQLNLKGLESLWV